MKESVGRENNIHKRDLFLFPFSTSFLYDISPLSYFSSPFFLFFYFTKHKKKAQSVNEIADSRGLHDFFPFLFSLSSFKKGFFSFRFCCCTTFLSIPKEKNQKRISAAGHLIFPIRWWWWCISLFTARSSFFLLPNTFEILIWKKGISCARSKNLCITFAQDVSLPPHRQELIMKQ